jgi:uncharacterized protein YbjQ (UPF0145 family)
MKRIISILVAVAAVTGMSSAIAVDEIVKFKISGGIATGKASTRDQIKDDIALYFGKQKTPAVVKKLWDGDSSQTSSRKSQQERCETAFASAIIRLQNKARQEGGNAVINITSGSGESSETEFTCTAGRAIARVRLHGTVVTLKK